MCQVCLVSDERGKWEAQRSGEDQQTAALLSPPATPFCVSLSDLQLQLKREHKGGKSRPNWSS